MKFIKFKDDVKCINLYCAFPSFPVLPNNSYKSQNQEIGTLSGTKLTRSLIRMLTNFMNCKNQSQSQIYFIYGFIVSLVIIEQSLRFLLKLSYYRNNQN